MFAVEISSEEMTRMMSVMAVGYRKYIQERANSSGFNVIEEDELQAYWIAGRVIAEAEALLDKKSEEAEELTKVSEALVAKPEKSTKKNGKKTDWRP